VIRRIHVPPARLAGGRAALEPQEAHYLRDVLRLAPGAAVEVFDGAGRVHDARVGEGFRELVLGAARAAPPPRARIELAFALAKGEKNDLVVQKAVELGAARLSPFAAERSVVRLDADRADARLRRWARIAAEAARQCGRADVPDVRPPRELAAVLADAAGARVVVFDPGGAPLAEALDPAAPAHLLVTGPEGGLAAGEVARCVAAGARVAALGPRVLRAETAALAAIALVQHRLGDLG
jgi:16S rRNA (uracil1498-N3)-methyltransferase